MSTWDRVRNGAVAASVTGRGIADVSSNGTSLAAAWNRTPSTIAPDARDTATRATPRPNRLADAFTLYACVWAVTGTAPGLETAPDQTTVMGVLLAYTTAKLAGSTQVTPGGVGTVDAVIIATLVAVGMTAVDATGAALVYRLISFALATVVGWVIYFLAYAGRDPHDRAIELDA